MVQTAIFQSSDVSNRRGLSLCEVPRKHDAAPVLQKLDVNDALLDLLTARFIRTARGHQ
jgi:hypothetical protein